MGRVWPQRAQFMFFVALFLAWSEGERTREQSGLKVDLYDMIEP